MMQQCRKREGMFIDLGGGFSWCRLRGLGLRVCYACQPHQVALQQGLQLCCFCCSALVEELQSAFDEGLIVFQVLQIQVRISLLCFNAFQL